MISLSPHPTPFQFCAWMSSSNFSMSDGLCLIYLLSPNKCTGAWCWCKTKSNSHSSSEHFYSFLFILSISLNWAISISYAVTILLTPLYLLSNEILLENNNEMYITRVWITINLLFIWWFWWFWWSMSFPSILCAAVVSAFSHLKQELWIVHKFCMTQSVISNQYPIVRCCDRRVVLLLILWNVCKRGKIAASCLNFNLSESACISTQPQLQSTQSHSAEENFSTNCRLF